MSAGSVVNVEETLSGSELSVDAPATSTTITVADPSDFQPDGGELVIGTEEKGYSVVNEDTGVVTLDVALVGSYLADDPVYTLPTSTERFAHVQLEDQEETLQARIPHALYPLLAVGLRDPDSDELELVELGRDPGGELIVADVLERVPLLDASSLDPDSTIPPPALTDGLAPANSPTPSVLGGVASLFVQWPAIANPDPVSYEVHVSTSSGFTPTGLTYAGESRGTLFVIRTLPGTLNPPAVATTYFVRLVAKDADGVGPVSAEDSATPAEGMDDVIIASYITANAILAEHLEAVLVLASTVVAGALGGGRVELGIATDESMGGMIGIHAMAADGVTPTFMVNSDTGEVFVKGNIEFGTGSSLLSNDIVEMKQQPTGSFETPIIRQTASGRASPGTTVAAFWPTATQAGATLFAVVACFDTDAAPPAFTTPTGWTLVTSSDTSNGAVRLRVYKITGAAIRTGLELVTLGDSVYATLQLFELQGVGVQDVAIVTASGSDTAPAAGPTTTPTQSDEIVLAGIVHGDNVVGNTSDLSVYPAGYSLASGISAPAGDSPVLMSHVFTTNIVAAATQSVSATLPDTELWVAWVVTFKAKAVGVEAPPAGFMRWYGRELAGATFPHVTNAEVEGAVVLGKAGEVWRLEVVSITSNITSIPAHSGVSHSFTAPTVKAGDYAMFLGPPSLPATAPLGRPMVVQVENPASADGAIATTIWNSDASAIDPPDKNYRFLVLHRDSP